MDTLYKGKIVRSDGAEFSLDGTQWIILGEVEGATASIYGITKNEKGIGDGDFVSGKRTEGRPLSLRAINNAMYKGDPHTMRNTAISFFNPKKTFSLWLTYGGRTRWISCELDAFNATPVTVGGAVILTVSFYAPDPYFNSDSNFGKDIASSIPLLAFPWYWALDWHNATGSYSLARNANIFYSGDVESYFKVVTSFTGATLNPVFYKGNNFIKINSSFNKGDIIEIDFENKRVWINGENSIQKVDKMSTFIDMEITPGNNIISYSADEGDAQMAVTVYYNEKFLGV